LAEKEKGYGLFHQKRVRTIFCLPNTSVGTICLERLNQLFHQANEPIIPTSPSKVLSLFTLKTIFTY
ncbi:hypothetical protein, partial [Cytobacillus firmus]|uniref:hypothetical protein n=1 Tax=Cytobacillus firmus TaxID=1399 RepID=UPI001C2E3685